MRIVTTIFFLALSTLVVFGQQRTVKGRLVSIEDGTPILGWNLMEPGTSNGTVTDINGEFTLTINAHPAIILFAGCFNTLYVEYEDSVDFKEIVLGTDNKKGQHYKDSKKAEQKFLQSRPTRNLWGEVIDRKTKKPLSRCEISVKGMDNTTYTDQQGNFGITVPNNTVIEIVIKKGSSSQTVVYDMTEDSKRIKLTSRE